MRPLRRKPKTLTEEPSLLDAAPPHGAGGGLMMPGEPGNRSAQSPTSAGSGGPAVTDEQAALISSPADPRSVPDPETLRRARRDREHPVPGRI
jgi:hypothetical protein